MLFNAGRLTRVLLVLLLPATLVLATAVRRASVCNGYSELCDRSFGNVTFVGAHDSYAVSSINPAANQDVNVTEQLENGVRMLQMQTHNESGTIQLCHTSCLLLNGGTLQTYLESVKSWMDDNTNDVVSLLIVNSYDNFSPAQYDTVFKAVGLDTLAYAPSSASLSYTEWPTLGDLIDNGTRLVVFLTTEADYTSVPYLIDEFSNIWETAYDVTTTDFDCSVNRTSGNYAEQMYLINHFLDEDLLGVLVPDKSDASKTNAVSGTGSLGAQVTECAAEYSRNPNFMLVDFYEYGDGSVFEVAATANGVTYTPSNIASPVSSGASGTSTASSSSSASALGFQVTAAHLSAVAAVAGGLLLGVLNVV
ncbi:PLC-like phosphodiesterase [Daedalea quercina L-15889]|uniref:PLC-like phosphodiesterase n=1 Tax=Daedalea quercina L-15889 TaxID=1314783 RepID=A0A165UIZ3_9APHY|nr:PLC-like phosphodiesterase [Daedalea quercina L-15889]